MIKTIFAMAGLLLAAGCGEAGSYELSWNIGCDTKKACAACAMDNAMGCSSVGLDSVVVRVFRGGVEEAASAFPCFSSQDGALGRGPGLDPGKVTLEVYGLSPGGQQLSGPATAEVTIPETGLAAGCVKLATPVACADGVDNDGDGLVDLHDPQCKNLKDTSEAK